jgi:hypothetical protein
MHSSPTVFVLCPQGLPLAGVLVWQGWQVKGLILGLLVATCITASVFSTTIARVDWEKESRAAVERATKARQEADSVHDDEPQQQEQITVERSMHDGSAGKVGKEWYLDHDERKEQKSNETELTHAAVSPVQDYHSLAIVEENKESPRPLEHI